MKKTKLTISMSRFAIIMILIIGLTVSQFAGYGYDGDIDEAKFNTIMEMADSIFYLLDEASGNRKLMQEMLTFADHADFYPSVFLGPYFFDTRKDSKWIIHDSYGNCLESIPLEYVEGCYMYYCSTVSEIRGLFNKSYIKSHNPSFCSICCPNLVDTAVTKAELDAQVEAILSRFK